VHALTELAARDERVVLLTADLGFMVLEEFADAYPRRFVNVGVAEANMLSMAAGMALRGWVPYCYSIATFASMRGYEQARNGAALHQLPVRIVAVGGGFGYGTAGPTHHAVEDVAVMRAIAGMAVVAPCDDARVPAALTAVHTQPGPVYLRLGTDGAAVPQLTSRFRWGAVDVVGDGDLALITYGAMTATAVEAWTMLEASGIATRVIVVSTLAPFDRDQLVSALAPCRLAITVEDHRVTGGVGTIVAETIAERGINCRLRRLGLPDAFPAQVGSERFMHQLVGIDSASIVATAESLAMPIAS